MATHRKANDPSADNHLAMVPIITAIKLTSLVGLVALAAGLPLFLVGTPCLDQTSPRSRFGGRLGSHTDLSLMRLLNSLDPSPDSPSMSPSSSLVLRALPSTIRPAVDNARVRLIILLVITCCFMVVPAWFTVAKAMNSLLGFRKRWLDEACDGEEIWWIRFKRAGPKQTTVSEKQAMALAGKYGLLDGAGDDPEGKPVPAGRIRAIYAIPDTLHLDKLIGQRQEVLEKLETAQTRYIQSFEANPMANKPETETEKQPTSPTEKRTSFLPVSISLRFRLLETDCTDDPTCSRQKRRRASTKRDSGGVNAPTQYVAPKTFYKLRPLPAVPSTSDDLIPRITELGREDDQEAIPTFTEQVTTRVVGSRFLEVQRSSGMFTDLPVGADLRIGTTGQLEPQAMPVTSDTESSMMGHGSRSRVDLSDYPVDPIPRPLSQADSIRFPTPDEPRHSMSPDRGGNVDDPLQPDPPVVPPKPRQPVGYQPISTGGSLRRPPPRKRTNPSFAMVSEDPQILQGHQPIIRPNSGVSPLDLGSHYQDIKRYRPQLIQLNDDIAEAQSTTYESMARGQGVVGLLVVGSGLHLPHAIKIVGASRESIKWARLQRPNGSAFGFWVATFLLTAAACVLGGFVGFRLLERPALTVFSTVTPFVGLAVASAPGLSHYLGFFSPLARDNGLASGLAEGVVPALAISLILLAMGYGVQSELYTIVLTNSTDRPNPPFRLVEMAKLSGSITYAQERSIAFKGLTVMLVSVLVRRTVQYQALQRLHQLADPCWWFLAYPRCLFDLCD
jgi:hypothetical protein